jgi:hypothetical protein
MEADYSGGPKLTVSCGAEGKEGTRNARPYNNRCFSNRDVFEARMRIKCVSVCPTNSSLLNINNGEAMANPCMQYRPMEAVLSCYSHIPHDHNGDVQSKFEVECGYRCSIIGLQNSD